MNTDALIHAVYGIVTDDGGLMKLLDVLAVAFRCPSATLIYIDETRPRADIAIAYGLLDDPAIKARYERHFAAIDPAPGALAALDVCDVASTDALFPDVQSHRAFLDGFYYPLGLRGALGGPILRAAGRIGMVAVQRGADRPVFDDDDVARLRTIMPHLSRALDLRSTFFSLRRRVDALDGSLAPLGLALMVFEAGCLTQANAAARTILARGDGLALTPAGTLVALDKASNDLLQDRVAHRTGAAFSISRKGGGRYYLRTQNLADLDRPVGGDRCIVLVCDLDDARADAADLIRDIYGMSSPAARLVAALLNGHTIESHAASTSISLNTAKFHLKAAFAAVGAHRQVDLVRRVSRLVDALGGVSA